MGADLTRQIAEKYRDRLTETLDRLHRMPELSRQEHETSRFIAGYLRELGIGITDIGQETGVVGILNGAKPGPCVALRCDIDALPVTETSSNPVHSENPGVMHACGHDMHITSLLGAASVLAELKNEIRGSVKFIFQPAEEINYGAQHMISCGVLEDPRVDAVYSLHNSPEIPTGTVAVKRGPIMAGLFTIIIKVHGKGGHGGIPHRNIDPVVCSAAIIQNLQTIVSRNVSPTDSGVISICSIHTPGAAVSNVVPDSVEMHGTVRFYREETGKMMEERIRAVLEHTAAAYGCTAELSVIQNMPATDNRPLPGQADLYPIALDCVKAIGAIAADPEPSGGADDFAYYRIGHDGHSGVPSFFYWLGIRNEALDCIYSWHSPNYRVDPDAAVIGAALLAESAIQTGYRLTPTRPISI